MGIISSGVDTLIVNFATGITYDSGCNTASIFIDCRSTTHSFLFFLHKLVCRIFRYLSPRFPDFHLLHSSLTFQLCTPVRAECDISSLLRTAAAACCFSPVSKNLHLEGITYSHVPATPHWTLNSPLNAGIRKTNHSVTRAATRTWSHKNLWFCLMEAGSSQELNSFHYFWRTRFFALVLPLHPSRQGHC